MLCPPEADCYLMIFGGKTTFDAINIANSREYLLAATLAACEAESSD